jgi:hypothetical protein
LVIISDHGQKTTDSEAGIHGDFTKDGNEGWIMFYNPTIDKVITQPSSPITLSTGTAYYLSISTPKNCSNSCGFIVDVHPTIWQFFSAQGASVAAENVGMLHPFYF